MKTLQGGLLSLVIASLSILVHPAVHAEQDYEFARALMDQGDASLATEDLVERLAAKLSAGDATRQEGRLISAALKRRQAAHASVQKRLELRLEADALYKEVLAGPKTFRLYALAETDAAALAREIMLARRALARDNPAEAARIGSEAAAIAEKTAAPFRPLADAAKPKVEELYKQVVAFYEKEINIGRPLPREIAEPLQKAFDEWMNADRRWVVAKMEQLECYDERDPAKKKLAGELAKHCEEISIHEALGGWPYFTAWYTYQQGRAHALVLDEKQASEVWKTMIIEEGQTDEALRNLVCSVVYDLVKLQMKLGLHEDVEITVKEATRQPRTRGMFERDQGKELIIDYARALTLKAEAAAPDFEKAIRELQSFIDKETARGAQTTAWSARFSRAMADILADAQQRGVQPKLSAQEWYNTAFGAFGKASAEYLRHTELQREGKADEAAAQLELARVEYDCAANLYRRALREARGAADPATRLQIEPKAWLELGWSHLRMGNQLEALVALKAFRDGYQPQARERWVPKNPEPRTATTLANALAEADKLVAKAGQGIEHVLAQIRRQRGVRGSYELDETTNTGERLYESAITDVEAADELANATDKASAEKNAEQAQQKYQLAAEKLLRVTASSDNYEAALFHAAHAYAKAHELWSKGRFTSKSRDEQTARAAELAGKALGILQRYSEYVEKNATADTELAQRRADRAGSVLLARCSLHTTLREWDAVVACADAYLAWHQQGQRSDARPVALYRKFKAQITPAARAAPAECAPLLLQADATRRALAELKVDAGSMLSMLNDLVARYGGAAQQARAAGAAPEITFGLETKLVELLESRFALLEATPAGAALEDHTNLLARLNAIGKKQPAADLAIALLKKFDPESKNVRIADDPAVWQALLAKMIGDREKGTPGVVRYNDLARWDRCKQDHAVLIDYMYDTREGAQFSSGDARRPAGDRHDMDMERALRQLETIRRNFRDCQTLDPKLGENGRALLTVVEDEIDFRRRIEATRDLLAAVALEVAAQFEKDGRLDDARRYRDIANEQLKILLELWGEKPALLIKSAGLDAASGNLEPALASLWKVKTTVDVESVEYFEASKKYSEILAQQKKWADAAEYPTFLKAVNSKLARERWPDMKEFLKRCEAGR